MPGRILSREIIMIILSALIAVFLFTGCSLLGYGDPKGKEDEKKIFGFLNGYNHRIKEAQNYLLNAGFNPGPMDGNMDRATRDAVKNFQKANGLKPTGFINSETWTKLSNYKARLMPVDSIKEVQIALKASGFDPGPIDGKMGQKTKRAIVEFQTAKGLRPSGQIDPGTLEKLKPYVPKKDRR